MNYIIVLISDDNYVYYFGQESLRRNGVALIIHKIVWNAVHGWNLKKDRMISFISKANSAWHKSKSMSQPWGKKKKKTTTTWNWPILWRTTTLRTSRCAAGFHRDRGVRDPIANNPLIMEESKELQKNIYFCFIDYTKALNVWITMNCGKFLGDWSTRLPYLSPEKPGCGSRRNS